MKSNLRGLKLVVQKQNLIQTVLQTTAIASKITFRNVCCTMFTGLVHRIVVYKKETFQMAAIIIIVSLRTPGTFLVTHINLQ